MKKKALISVLLAVACIGSGQANKTSRERQGSAQSQPTDRPSTTITPQAKPAQSEGSTNNHPPKGETNIEMSHWYSIPDWWLLGATLLTAGVIAYQSYFTKIAAKAADDAARASLLQTQHMVNAERPFLMIEAREGVAGSYDFFAINYGKSPAQLVFINNVPTVSVTKFGALLEDKPWYGFGFYEEETTVFNQQWIPPGKDRNIGTIDAEVIKIWVGGHPGLSDGQEELLVRGAIKYRGRFSKDVWHSKFCYRVFPDCLRMAGPYGWNDYT